MTKRTVANNFLYYIFCGFSGAVTSLIVWLFLKLMGLGIGLVWDIIPSNFDFKFYPIIVCTAGGIILGIWQKLTNAVPDELDEVMKKVKKDKFYPYNKVLLLCISALLPLVFGGSAGGVETHAAANSPQGNVLVGPDHDITQVLASIDFDDAAVGNLFRRFLDGLNRSLGANAQDLACRTAFGRRGKCETNERHCEQEQG